MKSKNLNLSYRHAPEGERPRERLLALGPGALSLQELLAILLSPGVRGRGCWALSQELVGRGLVRDSGDRCHDRSGAPGMEARGEEDLWALLSAGEWGGRLAAVGAPRAARARVLAAGEIGRRFAQWERARSPARGVEQEWVREEQGVGVWAQAALARVSAARRSSPREWLGLVAFHTAGEGAASGRARVGELELLAEGSRREVTADVRTVLYRLLVLEARAFVLVHNHPSGDCAPSEQDRALTRELADLGQRIGTPLLGHWVVASEGEAWLG